MDTINQTVAKNDIITKRSLKNNAYSSSLFIIKETAAHVIEVTF